MITPPRLCASGCGSLAEVGCRYCASCRETKPSIPAASEELDVKLLTLEEKLRLGGPRLRRIKRLGTPACLLCGRPCVPGRLYCCNACREHVRKHGPPKIIVAGVEASVREHAQARGLSISMVWGRLRLGMSPEEALTTPVRPQKASGPRRRAQQEETA